MLNEEYTLFTGLGLQTGQDYEFLWRSVNSPIDVYRMAITDCFLMNIDSPEVSALRRAYSLIREGFYRGSPEFLEACKIVPKVTSGISAQTLDDIEVRMEFINNRRRKNLHYRPSRAAEEDLVRTVLMLIKEIRG